MQDKANKIAKSISSAKNFFFIGNPPPVELSCLYISITYIIPDVKHFRKKAQR